MGIPNGRGCRPSGPRSAERGNRIRRARCFPKRRNSGMSQEISGLCRIFIER